MNEISIGNKYLGKMNDILFEVVNIEVKNDYRYVDVKCLNKKGDKKFLQIEYETFKKLNLKEI